MVSVERHLTSAEEVVEGRWEGIMVVQKWRRQPMAGEHFSPIFLISPQTLAVLSRNWSDSNSGERYFPPRAQIEAGWKNGSNSQLVSGLLKYAHMIFWFLEKCD